MSKPVLGKDKLEIPDEVIKSLLTPSETRMIKNRWKIMQLLKQGMTIRAVSSQVGVGTDTVVRIGKMIGKNNFQKEKMSKIATSWIFGKGK